MKLIGNKLTAAIFSLSAGISQADNISAELTTFTAGTPAKAAEVNGNFTELKAYSDSLQALISAQANMISVLEGKVTALENEQGGDDFTIAVMGDGELIGYTDAVPALRTSGKMLVKTSLGVVKIRGGYTNNYELEYYDPVTQAEGWGDPYFTDDVCTESVMAIYSGEGSPMLFTENNGLTDSARILPSNGENTPSYVIQANTAITTATTIYQKDYEGVCVLADWMVGETIVIPIAELDPDTDGLKDSFTTISVDGYFLN